MTKSVEAHHGIRCEPIECHVGLRGDDGNEARERSDGWLERRQPSRDGGKSRQLRLQICFGERRQETKRRLQGRVKSVFARLACELSPFKRREPNVLPLGQASAGIAVIAEKPGAEAIESGIDRWHEVNRVSRLVHGRSTSGDALTAP